MCAKAHSWCIETNNVFSLVRFGSVLFGLVWFIWVRFGSVWFDPSFSKLQSLHTQ